MKYTYGYMRRRYIGFVPERFPRPIGVLTLADGQQLT
jgi:hypothetical protein